MIRQKEMSGRGASIDFHDRQGRYIGTAIFGQNAAMGTGHQYEIKAHQRFRGCFILFVNASDVFTATVMATWQANAVTTP